MIGAFVNLLTTVAGIALLFVLWFILIRPVVSKAEQVMTVADESHDAREERERSSAEERAQAEQELDQSMGVRSTRTEGESL